MEDSSHDYKEHKERCGYTKAIDAILLSHAENLRALRWMCRTEAAAQRHLARCVAIPINIISALVGSGSAMSLILDYDTLSAPQIIINGLMIVSSVLTSINNTLGLQQKASDILAKGTKYQEIFDRLQACLVLPFKDRPPVQQFYSNILLEIEHSTSNGAMPLFSKKTQDKYLDYVHTHGMSDVSSPFDMQRIHSPFTGLGSKSVQYSNSSSPERRRNSKKRAKAIHPRLTLNVIRSSSSEEREQVVRSSLNEVNSDGEEEEEAEEENEDEKQQDSSLLLGALLQPPGPGPNITMT